MGRSSPTPIRTLTIAQTYLDRLNPEPRRAVEYGDGADLRRILLLTFSRRAAAEMGRRGERIIAQVLGDKLLWPPLHIGGLAPQRARIDVGAAMRGMWQAK